MHKQQQGASHRGANSAQGLRPQLRLVFNHPVDDVELDDPDLPRQAADESDEDFAHRLVSYHTGRALAVEDLPESPAEARLRELLEPYTTTAARQAAALQLYRDADGVWQLRSLRSVHPDQTRLDEM